MNRYKMKPGTTISDIKKYAEERKLIFNKGGKWISKDSEYVLFTVLHNNISLDIAFPKDLKKWDDFKHVLVMHEMIGQPYGPFYRYLQNPTEEPFAYLKTIIDKYNEVMESFPFLKKVAS